MNLPTLPPPPPPDPASSPPTTAFEPAPGTLRAGLVTVGLALLAGLLMFFTGDLPGGAFADQVLPEAAALAIVAAPVGLLMSWGEIDVSSLGVAVLGIWAYTQVDNHPAALIATAVLGAFAGIVIAFVAVRVERWGCSVIGPGS